MGPLFHYLTQENVENVVRIFRGDRSLSIRAISEVNNINGENVNLVLHEDLGIKNAWAKVVPKILTPRAKGTSSDLLC